MNILIVDDEKINLLSSSRLLEKRGYTVTTATNGLQALELIKESDFDCIIMDLEMPQMDGLEATKRIQDASIFGEKSKTPIIVMSGHDFHEMSYVLEKAGIKHYVEKPFDIENLVQTIEKSASDK